MNKLSCFLTVSALTLMASGAAAASCDDALAQLRSAISSDSTPALLSAFDMVRSAGCSEETNRITMGQVSAALATQAQARVAAGDLTGAEEALTHAPSLHWAVQAIRGDIAAKRGARGEAAQMYNAALDTITDPALTPPNSRLVPVADRIARLAQENMMLSGNLSASVTRGGQASGVLKSAMRGIRIEKAATVQAQTEGKQENEYQSTTDLYAGAPKENYVVADAVAAAVNAVYLPVRFASGSAEMDADGLREAETLANFLLKNALHKLTVVGHTDDVGSDAFNLDLSLRRAKTVRHFLQAKGVHAEIYVEGKGEREPPALVDYAVYSEEERRKIARRVELVLHE